MRTWPTRDQLLKMFRDAARHAIWFSFFPFLEEQMGRFWSRRKLAAFSEIVAGRAVLWGARFYMLTQIGCMLARKR